MANVDPRSPTDLAALAPVFEGVRAAMGFVPNSMLTMAHRPQLPAVFSLLATVAFGGDAAPLLSRLAGSLPRATDEAITPGLVQLVALASSLASGCRYCQAHTSHSAHRLGIPARQLAEILRYDESDAFSPAERAAVALGFAAATVPNETTAAHFDALRVHFNDAQIVQIVAVVALFGFLNRWNDTMATALEDMPREFAAARLDGLGWEIGKHGD